MNISDSFYQSRKSAFTPYIEEDSIPKLLLQIDTLSEEIKKVCDNNEDLMNGNENWMHNIERLKALLLDEMFLEGKPIKYDSNKEAEILERRMMELDADNESLRSKLHQQSNFNEFSPENPRIQNEKEILRKEINKRKDLENDLYQMRRSLEDKKNNLKSLKPIQQSGTRLSALSSAAKSDVRNSSMRYSSSRPLWK